jgi:all-trans-retinol 13,14-reductase
VKRETVIIGSGCSGMTAAITLAKLGHSVTVIEQAQHPSPILRGFSREGIHFDTGVHYVGGLGRGGILDTYFRYIGLDSLQTIPLREDGFDVFRFLDSGKTVEFPQGKDAIISRLQTLFPGEGSAIRHYWAKVTAAVQSSPFLNLTRPISDDDLVPDLDVPSLAEELISVTSNRELQSVLSLHCLLYGVPPEEVGFDCHAFTVGPYAHSAVSIDGGGKAVADVLFKRLSELGGSVLCSKAVTDMLVEDGAIQAVRLSDGSMVKCSDCIYTGHPSALPAMLPQNSVRSTWKKRLSSLQDTAHAIVLYGISKRPLDAVTGRNIFLCETPDPTKLLTPDAGAIYITGAQPEPDGRQAITIIATVDECTFVQWQDTRYGKRPQSYHVQKKKTVDELWKRACKGLPELADHVRIVSASTPLSFRHWAHSPSGSLYGVRHNRNQIPPMPMTKIKGLFLAGQSILLPGILGTMVSAFVTCGCMVGIDLIRKELRQCIRDE